MKKILLIALLITNIMFAQEWTNEQWLLAKKGDIHDSLAAHRQEPIPDSLLSENVKKFDRSLLIDNWDNTGKAWRFMVDPVNGDDNNDGLSWATAKKTINSIFPLFPDDMNGYSAFIFVKPGNIDDGIYIKGKINGYIEFNWVGAGFLIDRATNNFVQWADNGENITSTNDTIKVKADKYRVPEEALLIESCKNTRITFFAKNPNINAWVSGANYAQMWKFYAPNDNDIVAVTYIILVFGKTDGTELQLFSGCRIDLGSCNGYGASVWGEGNLGLNSISFYGGNGQASTRDNFKWRGALVINTTGIVYAQTYNEGWATGFEPPQDDGMYVQDIKQAVVLQDNCNDTHITFTYDNRLKYADHNYSYGHTTFRIEPTAEGCEVEYKPSANFMLQDLTAKAHITKNWDTGLATAILSGNYKGVGNDAVVTQSLSIGDGTIGDHDLNVIQGSTFSKLNAGETSFTVSSSEKWKTGFEELPDSAENKIEKIKLYKYHWKKEALGWKPLDNIPDSIEILNEQTGEIEKIYNPEKKKQARINKRAIKRTKKTVLGVKAEEWNRILGKPKGTKSVSGHEILMYTAKATRNLLKKYKRLLKRVEALENANNN